MGFKFSEEELNQSPLWEGTVESVSRKAESKMGELVQPGWQEGLLREGMTWLLNGEKDVSKQSMEGKKTCYLCRKQEQKYSEKSPMALPWNEDFTMVSGLLVHPSTLGSKFYEGRHSAGHGECIRAYGSWGIRTMNR